MAEVEGISPGSRLSNALHPIVQLFIRPWGRIGPYTHYTVNGRKEGTTYGVILNVVVTEATQTIFVKDKDGVNLIKSSGGLQSMSDIMYVETTGNPTLKAEINDESLWDHGEAAMEEQPFWDDMYMQRKLQNAHGAIFKVVCENDVNPLLAWTASVVGSLRSSAVILHIMKRRVTWWKKAILLMGMVKMFHCVYKYHKHPMPNGIPHLMPPGTQLALDDVVGIAHNVKLRISCVEDDKERVMDVLHETTDEVLLVLFAKQDQTMRELFQFVFRNQYGHTQFFSHPIVPRQQTIYAASGTQVGTIYHDGNVIIQSNGEVLFKITDSEHSWNTGIKTLSLPHSTSPVAKYFFDEINLFHMQISPSLSTFHKVFALQYGAYVANFVGNMWKKVGGPRLQRYRFRTQLFEQA